MRFSTVLNSVSLGLFDLLTMAKGYRFLEVRTDRQKADLETVNAEAGFHFPAEIVDQLQVYKNAAIAFIGYYRGRPAGIVRLGDPAKANRPYDLYGVDAAGQYVEIQSLVVAPAFRDGSQLVMLGLFKAMYCWSVRHGVRSWICCSTWNVYRTMRRYNRHIQLVDVDLAGIRHPLTQYMYRRGVFNTCYTMQVNAFAPWAIFRRFIRLRVRAVQPALIKSLAR